MLLQLHDLSSKLIDDIHAASGTPEAADCTDACADAVVGVLSDVIDCMCTCYEYYCCRVRDSVSLLTRLRKAQNADDDAVRVQLSMSTDGRHCVVARFIQRPVEHVKHLTLCTQRIYALTPTDHSSYEHLQDIVRALRRCTASISQEYIRQSRSNLASSVTSQSASTCSQSQTSINATSSCSAVDVEVVNIQHRLLFAENVTPFQLTAFSRHVIYTGSLEFSTKQNWTKVHTYCKLLLC